MIFLFAIGATLLIILYLFASPQLSPIPYFPSNKKDKSLIIKALSVKKNQTIIDLGAGDGWVIFEAAKYSLAYGFNTKFIAVDINPILVLTMNIKRLFHQNKKNITIIRANFFSTEFWERLVYCVNPKYYILNTTFYVYISPRLMGKTKALILKRFPNATIITYLYSFNDVKPTKILHGVKKIYVYK